MPQFRASACVRPPPNSPEPRTRRAENESRRGIIDFEYMSRQSPIAVRPPTSVKWDGTARVDVQALTRKRDDRFARTSHEEIDIITVSSYYASRPPGSIENIWGPSRKRSADVLLSNVNWKLPRRCAYWESTSRERAAIETVIAEFLCENLRSSSVISLCMDLRNLYTPVGFLLHPLRPRKPL